MNTTPDRQKIYQFAEAQAGYFTARQARQAGYSFPLLSHHVQVGRFEHLRRGIYRLAEFPEQPHADLFIAWLVTGGKGVVSHDSALALYGLSDALPAEIHLTIPCTASRRHAGIRLHTGRLGPQEITSRLGLPVTNVTRTLSDLAAAGLAEELLVQAIRQALDGGLVDEHSLREAALSRGGRLKKCFMKAMENEVSNAL